ncbi:Transposable element Hobo transposase [Frankliniella fusca]|uniref:Transposable element Hobo transposase n=1 Tax=Frankliniella fusca TaxID=407009 RepID=A0AAE1HG98_9NEOP|nr:Transposable element Hobo transposase [Frankliniella fusca]
MQEVEARWNSMSVMLESVVSQYKEIKQVLVAAKQKKILNGIDLPSLEWMTAFLKQFRDATTALEGQLYPSLPLVVPYSVQLREHCEADLLDIPGVEAVKQRALGLLQAKFNPTMLHKMATFLVPEWRHLPMLEEDERKEPALLL